MLVLDTGRSGWVWTVAFHPDGKHVLGGNGDGIRRWRLADGLEVGKQTGMVMQAISVSSDDQWIVCGTDGAGASVWDGKLQEKVIDVEGESTVDAVDVSPDSTRLATGTRDGEASIWSIPSGERLVGPLKHSDAGDTNWVTGIRFSSTGEQIATACNTRIHIFDSRTGDELVTINSTVGLGWGATTAIAWSPSDGQQIFAASSDGKIRAFDASTGAQLTESQVLHDDNVRVPSIALAANSKFIAALASNSILFLDTYTLARIGPIIEEGKQMWSVAISPDSIHFATGGVDGKIIIRDLAKILPESYTGPFDVSICSSPRFIFNVDKLCRYQLDNKSYKRSSLQLQVTRMPKYLAQ